MGRKRLLEIREDGTELWFEHDARDKKNIIHYKNPDVEPVLDYMEALRLSEEYTKKGIKKSWWHYFHMPAWFEVELRFKHGLDPYNPNHRKRIFEIVNRDYPKLKATVKSHIPRN